MARLLDLARLLSFLTALGVSLIAPTVFAAQIIQAKGTSLMIEFTAEETQPVVGSRFYGVVDGKKKALIEITKVKGNRAIGRMVKGEVGVDASLIPAPPKKEATEAAPTEAAPAPSETVAAESATKPKAKKRKSRYEKEPTPFEQMTWGALVGYGMDNQTVTVSNQSIVMTGSGFSLRAFADNPISGPIGLVTRLGAEQFSIKGSKSGTDVKTDLLYLTLDLLLRYNFIDDGAFRPYAHAGLSVYFPAGKSSDILDLGQVTATTVFPFGLGMNYSLSGDYYLSAVGEYTYFMPSTQVTTNIIAVRFGGGMKF